MTMSITDTDLRSGLEALGSGDARRARELFAHVVATGGDKNAALLGLAQACRILGDQVGKIAAVDQLLLAEPRNLRALILKADHLAATGEERSAAAYYRTAIKAAPPPGQVPHDLVAELRKAQQVCDYYAAHYQSHLVEHMRAKGFDPASSSKRFAQSLDIVLGRKRIYVQEPRYYYFPALPQIQFYERSEFAWLDAVESATADIRHELERIMQEPGAFAPYVQGHANRPRKQEAGMLDNPAWSAFYLWKNGEVVAENAARFPKTMQALRDVPLARVPNRSPSILFSLLRPGAHIPPHNGLVNTRLICHLPLIVPDQCTFRVGNDVRQWQEGRAWLFDDTIEHEAWNGSNRTRVILLFDVWRPELADEERTLVVSLFEAIDAHSGCKPDWEI